MRIGVDIKAFKNGRTGISRYLRNLLKRLEKIDKENSYYLFECKASEYIVENPKWKKILISWRLPGILWQQFILPFYLKKFKIDILWAPEQICPVFYKGIIFTTVHDLVAIKFPETCQTPNRYIQKIFFPLTIKASKFLLPVSEVVAEEIKKYYGNLLNKCNIVVLPNGSPEWIPEIRNRERDDFLFFAGNMEPRKNLLNLVEALEILYEKGIKVPLHIAGPAGWKNKKFFSRLSSSPIMPYVKFLGYISEEKLIEEYKSCRALIYPSLYEGFGLPVLEAMSLGCRIITSKGTVMEEIAKDSARYFNPLDPADIAACIERTISEPLPDEKEFESYRKILSLYSWEKSAFKLYSLFKTFS
ncbi:MAG: glycosyltransferase family 4 protein [Chitinispirillaceae bacterium]|nr:glycosyltransferase family 4 protein [Chitinispirillaceae bacterium]